MTLAAPWKAEPALAAPRIQRFAGRFAPTERIWRIASSHDGIALLFKAHPLDADPSESIATLIAAAPELRDAAQAALQSIEQGDPQLAASYLARALKALG